MIHSLSFCDCRGCGLFIYKKAIDLFHNGVQIKYSFVLPVMLISLSSLATTSKFQNNFCFKMRAVGPINIKNVKVVAIYESGLLNIRNL